MRIEDNLNRFSGYLNELSSKMTIKQKTVCKTMLEDILTEISKCQRKNELLSLELSGIPNTIYPDINKKLVDILILTGYDFIEVDLMNREIIDFMLKHHKVIEKSGQITAKRIQNIANLIRYTYQTTGLFPKTMAEVSNSFNEIKNAREQN
jgi:hypothetical protein